MLFPLAVGVEADIDYAKVCDGSDRFGNGPFIRLGSALSSQSLDFALMFSLIVPLLLFYIFWSHITPIF